MDSNKRKRRYTRGPHLFRRGEGWYLRDPTAKPPEWSLRTRDVDEAQRKLREYLAGKSPEQSTVLDKGPEISLRDLADLYLGAPHGWTRRNTHTQTVRVNAFVDAMAKFSVRLPSEISPAVVDRWIHDREGEVSRATINRDLVVARRLLAWGASDERRLCAPNPLTIRKNLREPKRRQRKVIPRVHEVTAVVKALRGAGQEGLALLLLTAVATGLRLDELRRLKPSDLTARGVHLQPEEGPASRSEPGKGYEDREIPLDKATLGICRAFVEWKKSAKGGKGKAVGLADTFVNKWLDRGARMAGVEPFRMHDLRRLFATEAVNNGTSIRIVSAWLGHKDLATTERYIGRFRGEGETPAQPSVAVLAAYESLTNLGPKSE